MQNDICSKNYSQYVDIKQYKDRNPNNLYRKPFTIEEINLVWNRVNVNEYFSVILILIYTGVRISELLNVVYTHFKIQQLLNAINKIYKNNPRISTRG